MSTETESNLGRCVDVRTRVGEFHGNRLMHLGHALMLLTVPLLIVASLEFTDMLSESRPWLGFVGGVMAVFGAVTRSNEIRPT